MISTSVQQVITEPGSIQNLNEHLRHFNFNSILLVTGSHSFQQTPIQNALKKLPQNIKQVRFFEFDKNPKIEDVEQGLTLFKSLNNPLVLAIGGGSVLDMAKLVFYFGQTPTSIDNYFENKHTPFTHQLPCPLIAVPTTAGTGSESTQFATLYINKVKHSLDTPTILPNLAIVDAELTVSLPPQITAESGMDALSQAVESYWSVAATDTSKALAKSAIQFIFPNIKAAVLDNCPKARAAMVKGSNLAGQAIHITRTTAPHAISYPMTSFFNISHGQAVSISLPQVFLFNAQVTDQDVLDSRGVAYVLNTLQEICTLTNTRSAEEFCTQWTSLMQEIGLKTSLKDLGISSQDHDVIIQHGFNPSRVKNNPRQLGKTELQTILTTIGG